jgi:hypothetical protein
MISCAGFGGYAGKDVFSVGCQEMSGNVSLLRKQERFLQALVLGASIVGAAKQADIAERTGHRWLNDPLVQAELERLRTATRAVEEREIATIMTTGYAAVHARVQALDRVAHETEKPYVDELTGKTYQLWSNPERLREWRGLLDDIASETGGRMKTTKKELSGGLDVTGSRDDLFNKLKAFADKHDGSTQS